MGRFKFLIFIMVAALLSCYKIPSKAPEWEIRINIPLGDTVVTTQDIVNDTSINHKLTIEIDPIYNDTLWTVFHYSDTAEGRYYSQSGDTVVTMTVKQKVSDNIDTLSSHFHSLARILITRIYVHGRCDTTFYGRVSLYLTPPDSFQHFVPFTDTFDISIPATQNLDTTLIFKIDSFPLGPYRDQITLHHDSGSIYVDSASGYAKMPIDFLARGDTIVTFLKAVSVDSSLQSNKDKKYLKKVIVHLVFMNRTAAAFTGNFRIGTKDSSVVWTSRQTTVNAASHDTATGFTYLDADPAITTIDDTLTSAYVGMTDEDSLYWKADLTIPPLGKVFLRPEDWIRMYGYVSIILWINPDSLGGGE